MTNYWLLKSEPQVYSIYDLEKEQKTVWDGVRNYQARNFLRQMKKGDLCFFYHSKVTPPAIVGLTKVIKSNIADPTQFQPQSPYYDPNSTRDNPRWQTVEIEFVTIFAEIITLPSLKQQFNGDELLLVRRGNRLSVMPIGEKVAVKILDICQYHEIN